MLWVVSANKTGPYFGHWHQPGNSEYPGYWNVEGLLKRNATHWAEVPEQPK